jgi:hypothetical protein
MHQGDLKYAQPVKRQKCINIVFIPHATPMSDSHDLVCRWPGPEQSRLIVESCPVSRTPQARRMTHRNICITKWGLCIAGTQTLLEIAEFFWNLSIVRYSTEHNISETGSVSVFTYGMEDTYCEESVRKS